MREIELVVVGAGPAGTAAARTAARLGIQTLLVDENPIDAASVQRNVPYWYGPRAAGWAGTAARARQPDLYGWLNSHLELGQAVEEGVELLAGHSVWGLFADRVVGVFDGTRTALLQARQVILASGATDLHLAFEGWTLGGVLGGGGALHLLETYGFLEVRRMVVIGAGNLGLEVARRCLAAGVQVVGVVEVRREPLGDPALAAELQQAGVPFYLSHTIRAARGGADVEEVVLARVEHVAPVVAVFDQHGPLASVRGERGPVLAVRDEHGTVTAVGGARGPIVRVRDDGDVMLEADAVCGDRSPAGD